ncbi:hypothetical protein LguiA_021761 [Lonicera macranthoides]
MDFRCVQCGFHIQTLYIQYSPGNIRLMKCENCKAVADEYIECEIMILLIDLILHKEKAYRHLFYNMFNRETMNFEGLLWKLAFSFLLLDAYRVLTLSRGGEACSSSPSFGTIVWSCGKMLVDLLFGNIMCACVLIFGTRCLLNASFGISGCKDVLLALLVSSYFKIFLIAMMVWEFPSSVLFIVDIFVLSSNVVALKVITDSDTAKCLGVSLSALALKFLVSWVLNIHPLKLVI